MSKARTRFLGVFLALFALCALFTVQALAASSETVYVSTASDLEAALKSNTTDTINLADDFELTNNVTVGGTYTLDLRYGVYFLGSQLSTPLSLRSYSCAFVASRTL